MSGFTRKIKKVFEYGGDKISVECRRLKRTEVMQLEPFFKPQADGSVDIEFGKQADFFDLVEGLLVATINKLAGVDVDGEIFSYSAEENNAEKREILVEILQSMFFLEFTQQVIAWVIEESMGLQPGTAEEKKPVSISSESPTV